MKSQSFTSVFTVHNPPETVFNSVLNFRDWWSSQIEGPTDELDKTFFYHYKDVHLCKIKLIEIIPNNKLVYLVVDNKFNFTEDQSEWINTKLIFELFPEDKLTKLKFTHEGLLPSCECYKVCQDAWTSYIQGSLKSLITTGQGKPNPKEGGLNAELVGKWGLPMK